MAVDQIAASGDLVGSQVRPELALELRFESKGFANALSKRLAMSSAASSWRFGETWLIMPRVMRS